MFHSVKGITKVQADNNIHSIFLIHEEGHLAQDIRLVRQDLSFINQHWLRLTSWLSCTCLIVALKMIYPMIFPGTKVRLAGI